MKTDENLHAGHRERVLNRLLENPDAFSEHEKLEALLFYFLPRKNTNELAHRLLRTFGSIENVLNANGKQLLSVEGVGKSVAGSLVLLGSLIKNINKTKSEKPIIKDFSSAKAFLKGYFPLQGIETFSLLLLDKSRRLIVDIKFCDNQKDSVSAEIPEIAKAFALHKPSFSVIAHNHPSDNVEPSALDDVMTKKINLLCTAHGVILDDHVIIGINNAYSYRGDGRLDKLKESSDLIKILNGQGE